LKKYLKVIIVPIFILLLMLFATKLIVNIKIPDVFYSVDNNEITFNSALPFLDFKIKPKSGSVRASEKEYDADLTILNIPLKNIKVKLIERQYVIPYGIPFGAKIFTNGVMIVNTSIIETEQGDTNPSEKSSLKKGDVILKVNDMEINTSKELAQLVEKSDGKPLQISAIRGDLKFETQIVPVKPVYEDKFRIGLWVRDSSAGIGTITFCIPNGENSSGPIFVGLGHGIRDVDTDALLPLLHGEIMKASIKGVSKPTKDSTGELRGIFIGDEPIGTIEANTDSGIYGRLYSGCEKSEKIAVATKQEVKKGDALMLSTVDGKEPKYYGITIDRVDINKLNPNKNISISINDEELKNKTGGIVQGMSGSTIMSKDKKTVFGALTHVCANNPLRGYGIFAERMINNEIILTI